MTNRALWTFSQCSTGMQYKRLFIDSRPTILIDVLFKTMYQCMFKFNLQNDVYTNIWDEHWGSYKGG